MQAPSSNNPALDSWPGASGIRRKDLPYGGTYDLFETLGVQNSDRYKGDDDKWRTEIFAIIYVKVNSSGDTFPTFSVDLQDDDSRLGTMRQSDGAGGYIRKQRAFEPVSYTHLTLPTILLV